jgi:soluble lytic murein transglycosylase-like protein
VATLVFTAAGALAAMSPLAFQPRPQSHRHLHPQVHRQPPVVTEDLAFAVQREPAELVQRKLTDKILLAQDQAEARARAEAEATAKVESAPETAAAAAAPAVQRAAAPAPAPAPPPAASYGSGPIQDIITRAFAPYGPAAVAWGLRVARCESGYNPRAYNGAGPYYGLFQFLMATFRATPYGGQDIWDPVANAGAAAWKFANGGASSWGCR